ncbi:MAG: hypothetical protein ACI9KE_002595 [Polyangiales bacterium]|jgi:hypothetical protein
MLGVCSTRAVPPGLFAHPSGVSTTRVRAKRSDVITIRRISDVVWGVVWGVIGTAMVVEAVSNWMDGGPMWKSALGGLLGAGVALIGLDICRRILRESPTASPPRKSPTASPPRKSLPMVLRLESYAKDAKRAISAAQMLADGRLHPNVEPLHLLFELVENSQSVKEALTGGGVDPMDITVETELLLRKVQPSSQGKAFLSRDMLELLGRAEGESARKGGEPVGVKHLLLACAQDEGPVKEVFRAVSLSAPVLREIVEKTSTIDRDRSIRTIRSLREYSREAKQAVVRSQRVANDLRHEKVTAVHLLFALGGEDNEEQPTVWDDIRTRLADYPKGAERSCLSAEVRSILNGAERLAKAEGIKVAHTYLWRALASECRRSSKDILGLVEAAMPTRDTLQ